jgi:hypothetical protein
MPHLQNAERALLEDIMRHFLESSDFNGIPLSRLLGGRGKDAVEHVKNLVAKRLADVTSGNWDNPHIIRMPVRDPTVQLKALEEEPPELFCVYPTTKYMRRKIPRRLYENRPFTRLLALAHAQLKPMFFEPAVLDRYHSDARYDFRFDGLDGSISITDEHYRSRMMAESDKAFVQSFGLGRNNRGQTVVVVFLRYLCRLASRHQRHWESHLARGKCHAESHYFRRSVFGQWTNGISVYDALLAELLHVNKMCDLIGLPTLFKKDFSGERPQGFGLLMRMTLREYLDFAHMLDKLISENLNVSFFEAEGISLEAETSRKDGRIAVTQKGTLRLLEEWLTKRIRFSARGGPAKIVAPLREMRDLRQKPAHVLVVNKYSQDYQQKKESLIQNVYMSVSNIRVLFQAHPKVKNYDFPEDLKLENLVLY